MTRTDYSYNSEYSELVATLHPELHQAYVEPKPTNWEKLNAVEQLFLRVVWVSGALPILGVAVLIGGKSAFKLFDIRNIIN